MQVFVKQVETKPFTSWLRSIHSIYSLSMTFSLNVFIILSSVLYTTSQYCCHYSTWHKLSIYLGGDHLGVQWFNLIWLNLNQKFSKLPLTLFLLYQCTTPFGVFKHVKCRKTKQKKKKKKVNITTLPELNQKPKS